MKRLARLIVLSIIVSFLFLGCQQSSTSTREVTNSEQLVLPLEFGLEMIRLSDANSMVVLPVAYYELFDFMRLGADTNTLRILSPYRFPVEKNESLIGAYYNGEYLRLLDVGLQIRENFPSGIVIH